MNIDAAKSADGKRVVVKLVNPSDAAREVSLELSGFQAGKASFQLVAPGQSELPAIPWSIPISSTPSPESRRQCGHRAIYACRAGPLASSKSRPALLWRRRKPRPAVAQPDLLTLLQRPARARSPDLVEDRAGPRLSNCSKPRNTAACPAARLAAKITPKFHLDLIDRKALGGKAVRKQITISFNGIEDSPKIHLLLYVPAKTQGNAPAILGLNFNGNQTVDADPGIELPEIWIGDPANPKGPRILVRAAADTRGKAASQWQVEKIIDRGYALATIYCGDIEPDFAGGIEYGVRAHVPRAAKKPMSGPTNGAPSEPGPGD